MHREGPLVHDRDIGPDWDAEETGSFRGLPQLQRGADWDAVGQKRLPTVMYL